MKNRILLALIIILYSFNSCRKELNEKQFGKWDVLFEYRNGSIEVKDTFQVELFQNHTAIIINNRSSFQNMQEFYWTTTINEETIQLSFYQKDDKGNENLISGTPFNIVTNKRNKQFWEYNDSNISEKWDMERLE